MANTTIPEVTARLAWLEERIATGWSCVAEAAQKQSIIECYKMLSSLERWHRERHDLGELKRALEEVRDEG